MKLTTYLIKIIFNIQYLLIFIDNFFIRRQTFGNQEFQDQNFFLGLKK